MGYLLLHSGQPSAKRLLKRVAECTGVTSVDPVASQDVVIRWGNAEGDDNAASWTLNPRQAIENTLSRSRMFRLLKLGGVYSPTVANAEQWPSSNLPTEVTLDSGMNVKIARHYLVPLFDMQPLALFRSDSKDVWLDQQVSQPRSGFREVMFDEDEYATRAVRMAMRSLHALGLDFGMVTVGITARDRTICLDVSATPKMTGRMLDLFVEAMESFIERDQQQELEWNKQGQHHLPLLMGTDLEFMLRSSQGKMVLASRYLTRNGRVGCDDRTINHDGKRFPLAELRPDPASTPEELMDKLYATMQEASKLITSRSVQWLAGSMPFPNFPIGGHIHFSRFPFSSRFVKALDNYLGLPVMMIEASQTSIKRRPRYGFLGDIRFKSHGGFEYRTLGCWLVSPEISYAVLALAYVVANHYRDLKISLFETPSKQRQFYNSDKSALRDDFEVIWREIEKTSTYRRYHKVLDVIPTMIREGIAWNEAVDLKQSWGLVSQTPSESASQPTGKKKRKRRGL